MVLPSPQMIATLAPTIAASEGSCTVPEMAAAAPRGGVFWERALAVSSSKIKNGRGMAEPVGWRPQFYLWELKAVASPLKCLLVREFRLIRAGEPDVVQWPPKLKDSSI